jgi:hypothetical protein
LRILVRGNDNFDSSFDMHHRFRIGILKSATELR